MMIFVGYYTKQGKLRAVLFDMIRISTVSVKEAGDACIDVGKVKHKLSFQALWNKSNLFVQTSYLY